MKKYVEKSVKKQKNQKGKKGEDWEDWYVRRRTHRRASIPLEVWAEMRADHELRGMSTADIAKRYDVAYATVQARCKAEGWRRQTAGDVVDRKAAAIAALADVEDEMQGMSEMQRTVAEDEVRRRLELAGVKHDFALAIYRTGHRLLDGIQTPREWRDMTEGVRNLEQAAAAGQAAAPVQYNSLNIGFGGAGSSCPQPPLSPAAAMQLALQQAMALDQLADDEPWPLMPPAELRGRPRKRRISDAVSDAATATAADDSGAAGMAGVDDAHDIIDI